MASMNTRLNIEKLDGYIVQKHGGSKQVGFKQLGPGVITGVHGVHDEKRVWFEVELQGAQGDRKTEVFQEKEYQTGWNIKTGNVLDSCNQRSTQQCMKSGVTKHLEDTTWSTNLVNRSPSSAIGFKKHIDMLGFFGWLACWNMSFNESGEYKKTFIGSGVYTGLMQVFHGFEFEVEPLGGHTFEVEPQARIAAMDKIYAHESFTFDDILACEVIFKWKARLKEDMDARSDVHVLSNGYRKSSDDNHDYYWEYAPDMFIHLFLYIDGMVFLVDARLKSVLPKDSQRKGDTDFVEGALHTIFGG
nr:zinc finger, CCHC-type [Tanacetum cinerariifolium]